MVNSMEVAHRFLKLDYYMLEILKTPDVTVKDVYCFQAAPATLDNGNMTDTMAKEYRKLVTEADI